MLYLTAAVVVIGGVCAVNLLLTMAVVRRLRHHAERLANVPMQPPLIQPGTALPEFSAVSSTGAPVKKDFFVGNTLVGMFSTACTACRERLPEFVSLAAGFGGRTLAVVSGDLEQASEFAAGLDPATTVVIEDRSGQVNKAFGVKAVPSFYIVDENAVITAAATAPSKLPVASGGLRVNS